MSFNRLLIARNLVHTQSKTLFQKLSTFNFHLSTLHSQFSILHCSFLILLFLFSSCIKQEAFEKYSTVKDYSWQLRDIKNFSFENTDTVSAYNLFLNIRNGEDYPYSNLWVSINIRNPLGKIETHSFGVELADNTGKWHGRGLGGIHDNRFMIMSHFRLAQKGNYVFSVQQNMREDVVPGVMDVGVRVEKVE